jgi:glycosyltransferase involved in cell wall biosynthesis
MNILFITIAWPASGERNLFSDLMDEFVLEGHNVYVIGASDSGTYPDAGLVKENGINVLRIQCGRIRKTSHFRKMVSLSTLGIKIFKAVKQYYWQTDIDIIICPTPPITLSYVYRRLKRKYKAAFYLLLKDIWPQGSVDHHVFHKHSIPWLYFRGHEIRIYKTADYIGCMSPAGVKYILSKNKYIAESKVEVCPNCIRPGKDFPEVNKTLIRAKYHIPNDACVFIFSGNLGIGHGLGFLIEAIRQLNDYSKAYFVIGGSGTHFQFLSEKIQSLSLKNVMLYEWLPVADFNNILMCSDVGLILLHKYTVPQFPSRLLSYLDYSKPVLCAVNKETDIGTIIQNSLCGRALIHGDLDGFIREVKYLSENLSERTILGINARKLLVNNYTVRHGYDIIMNHFIT